jgi:hypothetical protein
MHASLSMFKSNGMFNEWIPSPIFFLALFLKSKLKPARNDFDTPVYPAGFFGSPSPWEVLDTSRWEEVTGCPPPLRVTHCFFPLGK